jgi:hypothetical protein
MPALDRDQLLLTCRWSAKKSYALIGHLVVIIVTHDLAVARLSWHGILMVGDPREPTRSFSLLSSQGVTAVARNAITAEDLAPASH